MSKPAVRPLIALSILQLEEAFEKARTAEDSRKIKEIARELECRSVPKAKKLLRAVSEHMEAAKRTRQARKKPPAKAESSVAAPRPVPLLSAVASTNQDLGGAPAAGEAKRSARVDPLRKAALPVAQRKLSTANSSRPPQRLEPVPYVPQSSQLGQKQAALVLDTWMALEVLAPPRIFNDPPDLAAGDSADIAEFASLADLPWLLGERPRPQSKLFYQVVVGAIRMPVATEQLLAAFGGTHVDRPGASGFAPIAVLTLDRGGKPVAPDAIAISSFAWGLPFALKQDLAAMAGWPQAEQALLHDADKLVRPADEAGRLQPVTSNLIQALFGHLVEKLGLPAELTVEPQFAIRVHHDGLAQAPPAPPAMGSFYLGDLALAKAQIEKGAAYGNLAPYLGLKLPTRRIDLRDDDAAMADAVAPARTPLGKWPAHRDHPLPLLRQAAVNLAVGGEEQTRLLPISGPPGTRRPGLRDVVANLVIERAQAMSEFVDPTAAFTHVGKVRSGNSFANHYALADALRGFEILVASVGDEAAADVRTELSAMQAIHPRRVELRYFPTISDNLNRSDAQHGDDVSGGQESWGLIAAVFADAGGLERFKQRIWDDEELGLRTYLLETAGTPQFVQGADKETSRGASRRKPMVVETEKPPSEGDARWRWQAAQREFRSKAKDIRTRLDVLERGRQALGQQVDPEMETLLENQAALAERVSHEARLLFSQLSEETEATREAMSRGDRALQDHAAGKPSFFRRLIGSEQLQEWNRSQDELLRNKSQLAGKLADLETKLNSSRTRCTESEAVVASLGQVAERLETKKQAAMEAVDDALAISGLRFVDAAFFGRPDTEVQADSPWISDEINRLREDLFVAAMDLHRAFVDRAAKAIVNNLDLLFRCFSAKTAWSEKMRPIMPDLWATFFCVVPVVSTTLASIENLFGYLDGETLGWLLIDGAALTLPQQAVGALLRAKQAIVVGDAGQSPPVGHLPTELAETIAGRFGIDSGRFIAPSASALSLATASSVFGSTVTLEAVERREEAPAAGLSVSNSRASR